MHIIFYLSKFEFDSVQVPREQILLHSWLVAGSVSLPYLKKLTLPLFLNHHYSLTCYGCILLSLAVKHLYWVPSNGAEDC
ncbi:hypothetical protein Pfo_004604 [Paulownia fortunei]|nr:hypothetical protein Pfo_004604 [Paulownia fortunei]